MHIYLRIVLLCVASLVLTGPLALLIAPLAGPRPRDYLAAWLYLLCLAITALAFWLPARRLALLTHRPRWWPRWLALPLLGRSLAAWLCAALLCSGAAALLAERLWPAAAAPRAHWVRLLLDADTTITPAVALRYNDAQVPVAFQWQPYAQSMVALRPVAPAQGPLRVLAITTDAGPLPLAQVTARDGTLDANGLLIESPSGALLSWPQASRAFTLTLAGAGQVEALWFDQQARVELGSQPAQLALQLPALYQGWALLPPQPISRMSLELWPAAAPYRLRGVELLADTPQRWSFPATEHVQTTDCTSQSAPDALVVAVANSTCAVELPAVVPINTIAWSPLLLRWALLTGAALGLLALLSVVADGARRLTTRLRVAHPIAVPAARNLGWLLLAVWGVAVAWHVAYVLAVPLGYTYDSLNYYEFGQQLARGWRFGQIISERTPGYPAYLAVIIKFVGEGAFWPVLVQHLALSLLAPLTLWALLPRVPLALAVLAAIGAGVSPALSAMANIVHTEALFTFCLVASTLLYARWGERLRPLLAIGLLLGVGTMLRPAAILLLVVWLGWLLLWGWCKCKPRLAVLGCAALLLGHTAVAGPWQLHLLLARGTTDISDGRAGFTAWDAAVSQRRIRADLAAVRPDRAVWELWQAWQYNPYIQLVRYPQLITGIGDLRGNQRFYAASIREADARFPQRLRTNQRVALLYNLRLVWRADPTFRNWEELNYFLTSWRVSPQPPPAPKDDSLPEQFPQLVYRPLPPESALRTVLINTSERALASWRWLAALALLGALATLHPSLYRLLLGWLYWLALAAANAAIGMPFERYMVVVEPLLYILAAAALATLLGIRVRHSASVMSTELAGDT